MTKRHALPRVLTALALAATLPVAACGDDDDDDSASSEPAKVAFELKGSGKKPTMEAPGLGRGRPGRDHPHELDQGGRRRPAAPHRGRPHRPAGARAGEAWGDKGKALPGLGQARWRCARTPSPAPPARSTQTLEPGKYAVADINSNALAEFEVTGDGA